MSTYLLSNSHSLEKVIHESLETTPQKGVLQGTRKLTKGRSGKRIVFFPSRKNNALMPCESRLEADNCLDLEFDSSVVAYRTQPFTIDLGAKKSYTPDSIHENKLGDIVVREVKFSGALANEELLDRLDKIRSILSKASIEFIVLTENNLQLPPKINNYKFLYRCSHQKYDEMLIEYAIGILDRLPSPCSLRTLRNQCNKSNLPPLIADSLLFLSLASYDQNQVLTPDSLIWKTGGES